MKTIKVKELTVEQLINILKTNSEAITGKNGTMYMAWFKDGTVYLDGDIELEKDIEIEDDENAVGGESK